MPDDSRQSRWYWQNRERALSMRRERYRDNERPGPCLPPRSNHRWDGQTVCQVCGAERPPAYKSNVTPVCDPPGARHVWRGTHACMVCGKTRSEP